jgi:hypothetical protein
VGVGDSPTNSSYQYRNASVVYRRTDDSSHPSRLHLIKIEPVTFRGFYPARLNKNVSVPYIGQNVTMAGYGYSYSLGEGAMELSVPVKYVSAGRYFKAGGDDLYTGADDGPARGDDVYAWDDNYVAGSEIGPCFGT